MDRLTIKDRPVQIKNVRDWALNNTSMVLLLLMVVLGSVLSKDFLTLDNILNLFRRVTINGVLAIGAGLVIMVDSFDLSRSGVVSLCAVLLLGLQNQIGMPMAIVVAMGVGAAFGALNGFLILLTRGAVSEGFLITLGTQLLASGIALTYSKGYDICGVNDDWYLAIGQGSTLGIPNAVILWIALLVLFQILLKKTAWGRSLIIVGGNKHAAYLSGINVRKLKMIACILSGMASAVGAILITSRLTAANYTSGAGTDFDATIACLIGGVTTVGGKGGMVQIFVGVMIYGLITNICNLMGISSEVQLIIKGVVLAVAMIMNAMKERR